MHALTKKEGYFIQKDIFYTMLCTLASQSFVVFMEFRVKKYYRIHRSVKILTASRSSNTLARLEFNVKLGKNSSNS